MSNKSVYENTNGMPLADGKNLHLNTGPGDMANRIINVGSLGRAEKISTLLDDCKRIESSRGFTTFTGTYKGTQCSIVAIGMGVAMMDFFVRETRAVVEGPIVTIRYGTCGGVSSVPSAGSVVVAEQAGLVTRNPDAFAHLYSSSSSQAGVEKEEPYRMTKLAPADPALSSRLEINLKTGLSALPNQAPVEINRGVNVTADSFYSSQGRIDERFFDVNESVIDTCRTYYAGILGNNDCVKTMEMEAFQLLHLAKCASPEHPIFASAAAIVVADRQTSTVISAEVLHTLELEGGRAVLETLIETPL
jgi:uridine phosphorylase